MNLQDKIVDFEKIKVIAEKCRFERKVIGFTNGCFDIVHAGHVTYLEKAKNLVDVLIVGLNSDESIRRIKGKNRPINSEYDRALVLSALKSVDWVVVFAEDTPLELIKAVKPHVLIKGADWKGKGVVGGDFVESYGGAVKFIDFLDNRSTTNIIGKIIDVYCK